MTTTKPAGKKPAARSRRTAVPEAATSPGSPALDVLTGAGPARPAGAGVAHLELAPSDLVVEANVRTDLALDDAFVESIREHGVRIPIAARRDPLGQWLVVDGHRRHAAALKVGLPSVPVFELDGIGDDAERITLQFVANEQRTGLSATEKAKAIDELFLFGRSPKTIKRTLGVSDAEVEAAKVLAGKETTAAAVEQAPGVTLEQAAAIAEFDDEPEVVEALTRVAVEEPGKMAHEVQRARDEREERAVLAAAVAQLEAAGVLVLAERPGYNDKDVRELDTLTDDPAKTGYGDRLTPEAHAPCPGHAAHAWTRRAWDGGKPSGYRAEVAYYCTDWKGNGHFNRSAANTSGATSGPKSDKEKAEARKVRENNKIVDAAVTVRQSFITELLQRKAAPDLALEYAAETLSTPSYTSSSEESTAAGLLREFYTSDLPPSLNAKHWLFAHAAARAESKMTRDYWRSQYPSPLVAAHLHHLERLGYTLTEVEAGYVKKNLPKKGRG